MEEKYFDRNGVFYEEIKPTKYDIPHIGEKIGDLTAISPVILLNKEVPHFKNERDKYWVFLCTCGKKICRPFRSVVRGLTKNCGCVKDYEIDKKYIGKKFGLLTVLERDYTYKIINSLKNKNKYFICKCDCGNKTTVSLSSLIGNDIISCGCYRKQLFMQNRKTMQCEDLSKQKFFYLQPLYRDYEKEAQCNYPVTIWFCKCDCGNYVSVRAEHLKSGTTKSCGCFKRSYGEIKIKSILEENNIDYIYDKQYFKDLILSSGHIGRYDFILLKDNKPFRIIEFDGEQHKKPSSLFGLENFMQLQKNDAIKNEYAWTHNIPIIRIPYSERESLSLELLLSDKYLLKPHLEPKV